MRKTLSDRMNNTEEVTNVITETNNKDKSFCMTNETYESATYGFFALAGNVFTETEKEKV